MASTRAVESRLKVRIVGVSCAFRGSEPLLRYLVFAALIARSIVGCVIPRTRLPSSDSAWLWPLRACSSENASALLASIGQLHRLHLPGTSSWSPFSSVVAYMREQFGHFTCVRPSVPSLVASPFMGYSSLVSPPHSGHWSGAGALHFLPHAHRRGFGVSTTTSTTTASVAAAVSTAGASVTAVGATSGAAGSTGGAAGTDSSAGFLVASFRSVVKGPSTFFLGACGSAVSAGFFSFSDMNCLLD